MSIAAGLRLPAVLGKTPSRLQPFRGLFFYGPCGLVDLVISVLRLLRFRGIYLEGIYGCQRERCKQAWVRSHVASPIRLLIGHQLVAVPTPHQQF